MSHLHHFSPLSLVKLRQHQYHFRTPRPRPTRPSRALCFLRYKTLFDIESKEFRDMFIDDQECVESKMVKRDLDKHMVKEYFNHTKRLSNTRNKRTLMRIWNGDCLSYTRLYEKHVLLGLNQNYY
jgi:hypothetical protein